MTTGRYEDRRLLTGAGLYVADDLDEGVRFAGFVRADVSSARILSIETGEAREMPGVLGVFTAADLEADGIGPFGHEPLPQDAGGEAGEYPEPVLSGEIIRHLGEPLAIVVAETRGALDDAIEAIWCETEDVAPLSGPCFSKNFGDQAAADAGLAKAAHRSTITLDIDRATVSAMEPRGLIVRPRGEELHIRASTQNPFGLRQMVATLFGIEPGRIHVQARDVGGSFGLKGVLAREDAAVVWAARRLGVDLCWFSTRSEALMADSQGRALKATVTVGLDEDGRLTAVDAEFIIDTGAYPSRRAMGIINNINGLTGMYDVPAVAARVRGELSSRPPLAPFRGNGRPEATHAIERALDRAARETGLDRHELRRRNLVPPEAMPHDTGLGKVIDCGDFPRVMAAALERAGDPAERRAAAAERGLLYGFGLANCIETSALPRPDFARLAVSGDGGISLAPGVMSVGQGHETSMVRIAADRLGIAPERIDYVNGDTDALSFGRGSGGSSGLGVAGGAILEAIGALLDQGREAAAAHLGCAASEVVYRDGAFHREGGNENLALAEIAALKGGLWEVEGSFTPETSTFPNGTHICEVEIDPETGRTRVTGYSAIEDVGTVLNPRLVEGQIQGGAAMGLSIGLGERIVYDGDGQLLTGSFMDYQMIRAGDLPMFDLGTLAVPTGLNPFGSKGVGEAGTVGAVAALASAVSDALAQAGVDDFDLPATPARVWQALQDAKAKGR